MQFASSFFSLFTRNWLNARLMDKENPFPFIFTYLFFFLLIVFVLFCFALLFWDGFGNLLKVFFFHCFYFLMKYSWFTMMCNFQVGSKVIQLYVYIHSSLKYSFPLWFLIGYWTSFSVFINFNLCNCFFVKVEFSLQGFLQDNLFSCQWNDVLLFLNLWITV